MNKMTKQKALTIIFVLMVSIPFCYSSKATNNSKYDTFGRVFGLVKYYSANPYIESWTQNEWMQVCTYLVAQMDEDQQTSIQELLSPLSPSLTVGKMAKNRKIKGDKSAKSYYWQHIGGGEIIIPSYLLESNPEYAAYKPYYKALVEVDESSVVVADSVYSYLVGDGIYANIVHATTKENFRAEPVNDLLEKSKAYWEQNMKEGLENDDYPAMIFRIVENPNIRVADMIGKWNAIEHFYPYYSEDSLIWNNRLSQMINVARGATDPILPNYYLETLKALSPIKDGHVILESNIDLQGIGASFYPQKYLPINLGLVEGTVFIKDIDPSFVTKLASKDVVTQINGVPVMELLQSKKHIVNAATDCARSNRALGELLSELSRDSVRFIISAIRPCSGSAITDTLFATSYAGYYKDDAKFITHLNDNVVLLNPQCDSASYEQFVANIESLQSARGLIFDLRGYPMYDFARILAHFSKSSFTTPTYHTSISCLPNHQKWTYNVTFDTIRPMSPYISPEKVIFLTNESAISWAETVMMTVKGNNLGVIVGSPTAGTNGDVTNFPSPIFNLTLTGLKVINVDGSQHHGIGVLPDIVVYPTSKGIQDGRDEVLEKAIQILKSQNI